MVRFGVPPIDALRAGTAWAAEACGVADQTGTLEPGKLADVVGVDGDPLSDIEALRSVKLVMRAGRRYDHLSIE
jgi:imidazolonepropionase-like amidohydrolase